MTVKELIETLQKLPPKYEDAAVLIFSDNDWYDGTCLVPVHDIEISFDNEIILRDF